MKLKSIFKICNTFLIIVFFVCQSDISLVLAVNIPVSSGGSTEWLESIDPELKRLRQEIQQRQSQIQDLDKQQKVYEDGLAVKRREVNNLKNQISIIDDSISSLTLQTESAKLEVNKTELEIKSNDLEIREKEKEVDSQLVKISGILLSLDKKERRRANISSIIISGTLNDWLNSLTQLKQVERGLSDELDNLQALKDELTKKANLLQARKVQLENIQARLTANQERLQGEQNYKNKLLKDTKNQEGTYQKLLSAAKAEQNKINADIQSLEIQSRKVLAQRTGQVPPDSGFIWPVTSRIISAYFHDPDYPFRNVFEHPAIDIGRTPQGSPVRAIKSGYVARVKYDGSGSYAYVMVVHSDGLSSVYGHLSKVFVNEDSFVAQGEVIALSGGSPGTPGAGSLTTGPHLHLEIRLNGIPVDPLEYLP